MYDIPGMVQAGLKIIDKIIPDADAKNRAKEAWELEVIKVAQAESVAQSVTNTAEAAHSSFFVSAWRPFVGWVCGIGFAWATIGQPILSFTYALIHKQPAPVIALPTDILMTTLLGMLGLGTLRTFEKLRGVSK
jgi:hypothetical protein